MAQGVMIIAEQREGEIRKVSFAVKIVNTEQVANFFSIFPDSDGD